MTLESEATNNVNVDAQSALRGRWIGSNAKVDATEENCAKGAFNTAIAKAFNMAVMLTGSAELAERCVQEAIELWDHNEPLDGMLWLLSITSSLFKNAIRA